MPLQVLIPSEFGPGIKKKSPFLVCNLNLFWKQNLFIFLLQKGLYLHEVGHAIGLVHEHQLPDRDQHIKIIYENVLPSMRIWFNKYSTNVVNTLNVPYELSSVMHYGITVSISYHLINSVK